MHTSCSCPWDGGHHLAQRNPVTREPLPAQRLGMVGQGSQSCGARKAVFAAHLEAGSSASDILKITGWVGLQDQAVSQAAHSFSPSL